MRFWSLIVLAGCGAALEPAPKVNLVASVTDDVSVPGGCLWLRAGDTSVQFARDGGRQLMVWRVPKGQSVTLVAELRDGRCMSPGTLRSVDRKVVAADVSGTVVPLRVIWPDRLLDGDGDGFIRKDAGGDDCNDGNQTVNPAAAERCDLEDRNCNGVVGCNELSCGDPCRPPLDGGRDSGVDDAGVIDAGVIDAGPADSGTDFGMWTLAGGRSAPLQVGECVRVDLVRTGLAPATFRVDVGPGLTAHRDAMCSQGAPTAIAADQQSLSFYIKGTSAQSGTISTVQVIAMGGPATNLVSFEPLPLVRRGTLQLTGNSATVELDGGTLSKSFLVFQASTFSGQSGEAAVRCRLADIPFRVECDRGFNNANVPSTIEWQVVSHATALDVRHIDEPVRAASETFTLTPRLMNANQAFVLGSEKSSGVIINGNNYIALSLPSNTSVRSQAGFSRDLLAASAIQVVTLQGTTVEHDNYSNVNFLYAFSLGTTPARSVLLTSVASNSESQTACAWGSRSFVDAGSSYLARTAGATDRACQMKFDRGESQRIAFPAASSVNSVLVEFTGSITDRRFQLGATVSHRTLLMASDQSQNGQSGGETSSTSTGAQSSHVLLSLSNQELAARLVGNGGATSRFTVWVIELTGL